MQTLQHELELTPEAQQSSDHLVLRGLAGDQAMAHAEEVRLLRQRVATLEAALEAAKAQARSNVPTSEFTEPLVPAVVSVQKTGDTASPETTAHSATPAPPESPASPGFAQAWAHEDEASFEERVAEKAFFQATTVDEQSRSWLMER